MRPSFDVVRDRLFFSRTNPRMESPTQGFPPDSIDCMAAGALAGRAFLLPCGTETAGRTKADAPRIDRRHTPRQQDAINAPGTGEIGAKTLRQRRHEGFARIYQPPKTNTAQRKGEET